jgi:hypothetical protein
MSVNAIHGKNAIIYLGSSAAMVGEQVDYDITMTSSFVDTTTLPNATGAVWNTQVKGPMGWAGKCAGKFDPTSHALWDLAISDSATNFYLYPSASSMTKYYYGTAFVSLPTVLSGGVKKDITNALALTGTSELSYNA